MTWSDACSLGCVLSRQPDEYPFQDPNDQLIADQLQTHVITRSQSQAAERAKQNDLILFATPQQAEAIHSSRKGAKPALASKPISAAKDCIDIPMSEMPELSLAHAFVTKSQRHVEFATNSYVQPPRSKFGKK